MRHSLRSLFLAVALVAIAIRLVQVSYAITYQHPYHSLLKDLTGDR